MLGPDPADGSFKLTAIKSIHYKRLPVQKVRAALRCVPIFFTVVKLLQMKFATALATNQSLFCRPSQGTRPFSYGFYHLQNSGHNAVNICH